MIWVSILDKYLKWLHLLKFQFSWDGVTEIVRHQGQVHEKQLALMSSL